MSSNNMLMILKEGEYFCVHHNLCVDNDFVADKDNLLAKKNSLIEAIKFAKKFCNEEMVEYGYSVCDSALGG